MDVIKPPGRRKSRNLVFTSAGDVSSLPHWLKGRRDFDLWVIYYGDQEPPPYTDVANFYARGRGTKFQNLYWVYTQYSHVIERYDAVMVLDDDILIDANGLTRLFEIRKEHDLWIVQPAFRLTGKISWDITRVTPAAQLRYTNFIEMTCPLFRRDMLDVFMGQFDPSLSGYGEDWWFLHLLGPELENRVAIADEVSCVNPFDNRKGGQREMDRLNSHEERKAAWERIKLTHGIKEDRSHVEYGRINNTLWGTTKALARYVPDWARFKARSMARSLLRSKAH
ncbi:MAG TPA: hypothetical protein VGE93_14865 [Bryobacteraceae bacterium]